MKINKMLLVHAMMGAAAAISPEPLAPAPSARERDKLPRKFTDARKAEAEAKRQRKAEKRAKAVRHG